MDENLKEAVRGLEEKIDLKEILLEDEATAKQVGFIGSPTLLINGEDIA
jgi:protein-disulfide isomerase